MLILIFVFKQDCLRLCKDNYIPFKMRSENHEVATQEGCLASLIDVLEAADSDFNFNVNLSPYPADKSASSEGFTAPGVVHTPDTEKTAENDEQGYDCSFAEQHAGIDEQDISSIMDDSRFIEPNSALPNRYSLDFSSAECVHFRINSETTNLALLPRGEAQESLFIPIEMTETCSPKTSVFLKPVFDESMLDLKPFGVVQYHLQYSRSSSGNDFNALINSKSVGDEEADTASTASQRSNDCVIREFDADDSFVK